MCIQYIRLIIDLPMCVSIHTQIAYGYINIRCMQTDIHVSSTGFVCEYVIESYRTMSHEKKHL